MRKENNPESRHAAPKGGKPVKRHRYKKSVRVTVSILSSLMVVVSVLLMTAGGYVMHAMNLIVGDEEIDGNYVDSLPPDDEDPDVSIDTSFNPSDYDKSEVSKITLRGNTKDVTNLLLLGIDARTMKERGRSDSMIIVTINKKNKTIKLSSLLRDTAVTIPGRDKNGDGQDDYAKLNAAYAYGGFNLLSKTIEQNFRLKIDKYVGVNFVVFPIAVDAMGGIDIYMTAKEASKVCAQGVPSQRLSGPAVFPHSAYRQRFQPHRPPAQGHRAADCQGQDHELRHLEYHPEPGAAPGGDQHVGRRADGLCPQRGQLRQLCHRHQLPPAGKRQVQGLDAAGRRRVPAADRSGGIGQEPARMDLQLIQTDKKPSGFRCAPF